VTSAARHPSAPAGPASVHARPGCGLLAWLVLLALWLGLAVPLQARAQALQPVPALSARVIDQALILSESQRRALEDKLAAFERERGSQVVLVLVRTTAPEDIFDYTQRLGDAWKIGRKGVGDGVLLVVARDDRHVRIATAKAVEGAIPDVVAGRIIEQVIAPRFRQGDYYGGLDAGLDQILARLRGEALPLPGDVPAQEAFDWRGLLILLAFAVATIGAVLRRLFGRGPGSLVTAGLVGLLAWLFTASLLIALGAGLLAWLFSLLGMRLPLRGPGGPWGGGGWGGGGGGFSSGGGGNFGGGGASGRW
jgi:uncharacterized protein